jgi:diguanylate cyclase
MGNIISQLFINSTIIIAFVLLANMLLKDILTSKSFRISLINGLLNGILGCVLMIYSVSLKPDVIIDFRYIPIILTGLYVSLPASLVTAIIIGLFRIAFTSLDQVTIIALITALVVGLGSGIIGKTKIHISQKWLFSVVLVCIAAGTGVYLVTRNLQNQMTIIIIYLSATIIISMVMFYLTEYVAIINRKYDVLKDEAEKDFLTGLNNPRQFYKSLNQYVEICCDGSRHVSLLYIDIDHFKMINDTYGHDNGDTVLKEMGIIFKQAARNKDIVSRKGGEEFAVLLIDCNEDQAVMAAERIRWAVENHEFKLSDHSTVKVTISIGISSIPEKTTSVNELIELADKALYSAKQSGRNRVMIAAS